jgi:N-acetylglucosamine-6-phosphate deacetylase
MKERLIKIFNGNIITPYKVVQQGTVVIKGDKIIDVSEAAIEVPGAVELDAKGHYVMPGFIDIHVHGGGGCDFMDGEESSVWYHRHASYNAHQRRSRYY